MDQEFVIVEAYQKKLIKLNVGGCVLAFSSLRDISSNIFLIFVKLKFHNIMIEYSLKIIGMKGKKIIGVIRPNAAPSRVALMK